MALLICRDIEEELIDLPVVIIAFTIDRMEGEAGSRKAFGSFRLKDYVEHGIEGDHNWEAQEMSDHTWDVKASADNFWQDRSGNFLFTLLSSFNQAALEYIAEKLANFCAIPVGGLNGK